MMGWGYGMGGGWLLMTISWVLLIAVLIGLAVWIFPRQTRRTDEAARRPSARRPSPREVLDQRLASGELDVDNYRQLRAELTNTEVPTNNDAPTNTDVPTNTEVPRR